MGDVANAMLKDSPCTPIPTQYLRSRKSISVKDASSTAFGTASFSVSALLVADGAIEFEIGRPPYLQFVRQRTHVDGRVLYQRVPALPYGDNFWKDEGHRFVLNC